MASLERGKPTFSYPQGRSTATVVSFSTTVELTQEGKCASQLLVELTWEGQILPSMKLLEALEAKNDREFTVKTSELFDTTESITRYPVHTPSKFLVYCLSRLGGA